MVLASDREWRIASVRGERQVPNSFTCPVPAQVVDALKHTLRVATCFFVRYALRLEWPSTRFATVQRGPSGAADVYIGLSRFGVRIALRRVVSLTALAHRFTAPHFLSHYTLVFLEYPLVFRRRSAL